MNNSSKMNGIFSKFIVFIVVITFIIIGIIYIVISIGNTNKYLANNPIIISGKDNRPIIPSKTLPIPPVGNNYSISTWIFINDFTNNYGKLKNILFISSDVKNSLKSSPTELSPGIMLDKEMNNLIIKNSTVGSSTSPKLDDDNTIIIKNIPLRKWVNIVYVLNNNVVDIYINGKLEKSKTIKGLIYTKDNSKMFIREVDNDDGSIDTYSGSIAQLQYFTTVLQPNDIIKLYSKGISGDNVYLTDMNDKLNSVGIDIDDIKANICDSNSLLSVNKNN